MKNKIMSGYISPYHFNKKAFYWRNDGSLASNITVWNLKHYKDYKKVIVEIKVIESKNDKSF